MKRYSLSEEELSELVEYCKEVGIDFSSTPYSENEVDFLVENTIAPFIKIASMELNNLPFLKYIGSKGVPVILSTGMGTFEEIEQAVSTLEESGNNQIVILHCISISGRTRDYQPEKHHKAKREVSGICDWIF